MTSFAGFAVKKDIWYAANFVHEYSMPNVWASITNPKGNGFAPNAMFVFNALSSPYHLYAMYNFYELLAGDEKRMCWNQKWGHVSDRSYPADGTPSLGFATYKVYRSKLLQ